MGLKNIPGKSEREKKKESGGGCWFSINRCCSEHPTKVVEENWERAAPVADYRFKDVVSEYVEQVVSWGKAAAGG